MRKAVQELQQNCLDKDRRPPAKATTMHYLCLVRERLRLRFAARSGGGAAHAQSRAISW